MCADKPDVLLVGQARKHMFAGLQNAFTVHHIAEAGDSNAALIDRLAPQLRYAAVTAPGRVDAKLLSRLPKLEIVASLGVGYDNVDVRHAGGHGIVVTNTPGVLNEEVADTALGLLLCTVRQFPQADRFVRAGKWQGGDFPLSDSCTSAPSAWSASAASDRRSPAGSTPCGFRSSTIPDARSRVCHTATTRGCSTWPRMSMCCW
jgi:lactate dehydrogenase-like 2-hydroxyacid dehydrogenase